MIRNRLGSYMHLLHQEEVGTLIALLNEADGTQDRDSEVPDPGVQEEPGLAE
jgi:hypothetical protein